MKKILFFAAALAVMLTSCQKEKASDDSSAKGVKTITASIGNSTKVAMGIDDGTNTKLNWEIGDNLFLMDKDGLIGKYSSLNAGEIATFNRIDGDSVSPEGQHVAAYPYDGISIDTSDDDPKILFKYSDSQTYTENSFDKNAMPLLAMNETGTNFSFNAMAPVLRLNVKLATAISDVKVNSVVIESESRNLSGFSNWDDSCFYEPDDYYGDVGPSITLNCGEGVSISTTATQFCMVIPANLVDEDSDVYPSGDLTITVHTNKGDIVKTSKSAATFKAGMVYNINISGDPVIPVITGTAKRNDDIDVNWVQLWEDGPKFAEYNIGAANNRAQDYGSYFTWGGTYGNGKDIPWLDDHNTGRENLTGNKDTATRLWGSNWRMPTKEELKELASHEYCQGQWTNDYNGTGVKGVIFTGKGDYASNSVFLPAAGECHSDGVKNQAFSSYYWSSTRENPRYDKNLEDAYALGLNSAQWNVGLDARFDGFQVRAVLK